MVIDNNIEQAISLLESTGNFRVLRRLPEVEVVNADVADDSTAAIVVDVETTGLDVDNDEVIQLGMIKFTFDRTGRIGRVVGRYESFNEPSIKIPSGITSLSGIRDEDVKGHKIRSTDLDLFVDGASLVIAHNAAFDRPFCERLFSKFAGLSWACTATEIDWYTEGESSRRLEHIAQSFGYFYNAHRALDDCNAVLNILSFQLPRSRRLALSQLLNSARQTTVKIFAEGASYELRGLLRHNGYRWNDGRNGFPRAWWKNVSSNEPCLSG